MAKERDVTAVVTDALRVPDGVACQPTRRVAVGAVVLAQCLVCADKSCVLVVRALQIRCSCQCATGSRANYRDGPRTRLCPVVCLASILAHKIVRWRGVARRRIPPTGVEYAFECTIGRTIDHGLHAEASTCTCEWRLCSRGREPLPP